jgi:ribosomal protein S18 acetylase RimI-like enzyme
MSDLPGTFELVRRHDLHWFGAQEHDADEVGQYFDLVSSLDDHSLVLLDGERIAAVALWTPTDTWYVADPQADLEPVHHEVIAWFGRREVAKLQALSRDEVLRAALQSRGWRHSASTFDLLRAVDEDWAIAPPVWPDGVHVHDFRTDEVAAVHHLIYVDAAWADVPGHPYRDYDSWRRIFVTEHTVPEQQVLARRGDRLVGAALGRTFSDGTGWIAQLAVATDERGNGLGRALLREALRRRCAAGATTLGLAVQADNRGALALYLDTGLRIDREWMEYRPG